MPSPFEKRFALSSLPGLYKEYSRPGYYTDTNGSVTNCDIRITKDPPRQVETSSGSKSVQTSSIQVQISQVPVVSRNGRFSFESEVWTISDKPKTNNGQHYCSCVRIGNEKIMPLRAKEE